VRGLAYIANMAVLPIQKHDWKLPTKVLCILSDPAAAEAEQLTNAPQETAEVAGRLMTLGACVNIAASVGADVGRAVFERRGIHLASSIEVLEERPTPDWLLTHFPQYDHVFYSGHGVGASAGNLSGLMLSDESGRSAILSVIEILTMSELKHIALIYLSACETAEEAGDLGPELFSFVSSLLRVGARFVVGSLWRVSDEAAYTFTKQFYEALATLRNPSEAFCVALTELTKIGAKRDDPTYWGPFIPFSGA
jgi:hypothetical protein